MALDKLLEHEANAEIEQIRAHARGRAEKILAEANERAAALVESRQRQLEANYQAGIVRARSAADLECNAARLSASEGGLQKAYELARGHLSTVITAPEYRDILGKLIKQAHELVPDAEAIEVHPSEVSSVRALADGLEVRENENIQGGVRVVAKGGKSGVTNTLLGRLERVKSELAPEVSRILAQ